MSEIGAIDEARRLFLDEEHVHGCAETAFVVLKMVYGLPDAADSSAAMAINGGVAHRGGICGAVAGAAMAVGLLATERIADHVEAKQAARRITGRLMDAFEREYGSSDCLELIGMEIRTEDGHQAFLDSDIWRDRCMRQIEFAIARLAPLADRETWERELRANAERTP